MSGHQSGGVVLTEAERAWLVYRNDYIMTHGYIPTNRTSRRLRKREFLAGYNAALAAQAGRVAEVVEKVLGECAIETHSQGGSSPTTYWWYSCRNLPCEWRSKITPSPADRTHTAAFHAHVAARVAAELEADQ